MKKGLSLVLLFMLLLNVSFGLADAVDDFYQFTGDLRRSLPENFITTSHVLMQSPIMRQTKPAEEIFADAGSRCTETATRYCEVLIFRDYSPVAEEYFGTLTVEPDLTKPSYIGRDGNILSMYVPATDCGCFMVYDLTAQITMVEFIRMELEDQVESVLFQRCADGYYVNDASELKEAIEYNREMYEKLMAQMMGS